MTDLLKLTDLLATKGNMWLLAFMTVVFAGALVWVVRKVSRYYIDQHERLIAEHRASRESYGTALKAMCADNHSIMKELAVCLGKNTDALKECSVALQWFGARKKKR
jgi:cbb3-type cytochrome oxidase subunit 3